MWRCLRADSEKRYTAYLKNQATNAANLGKKTESLHLRINRRESDTSGSSPRTWPYMSKEAQQI